MREMKVYGLPGDEIPSPLKWYLDAEWYSDKVYTVFKVKEFDTVYTEDLQIRDYFLDSGALLSEHVLVLHGEKNEI